jgi:predicted dehydrogenase
MAHGIGIIGLGIMGERMLRNLKKHPGFAVVAAWDPDADAAARLAAIDRSVRFAGDAADLAGDAAVDCLYIASPPSTHLAYADLAFDHGKKVFAEKPLAVDLAASHAAATRAERERRVAAVNFPFASAPAVRAIAASTSPSLSRAGRAPGRSARAGWRCAGTAASCAKCCRISCS